MKNTKLRTVLSSVSLMALALTFTSTAFAAPVRYSQVVQVVNAKPGRANTGGFTQLQLADDPNTVKTQSSSDDPPTQPQDKRVIVTTTSEMVEDEACDCEPPIIDRGGFPKWALLGLAAIPIGFIVWRRDRDTPTPTITPTTTTTTTPPMTPTTTPSMTPTTTMTPPITQTPTPEPVPEPMTILLFGTGLAGIGIAARKRMRRKSKKEQAEPESEE